MRSYYARVEHKVVVGVDIVKYLAVTSLILIRRHHGMKRPGPTLHVLLRERRKFLKLHAMFPNGGIRVRSMRR